ncbi:MAG: hemerythrin domain-containing protein [Cyanobacteriota bacterium]|nr:hemerythrin domain-containing protein [Cyanobacteriota bacterium]
MMSSSPRTLVHLCEGQHQDVLDLLYPLTQASSQTWSPQDRLLQVQRLRQRLSRHLQLERHAFYPPLRQQTAADAELSRQLEACEQGMSKLLPQAIGFLHEAERNPGYSWTQAASSLYQKLAAQFEWENRQLHPLFLQYVPLPLEQKQLKLFRRRLLATVSQHTQATPLPCNELSSLPSRPSVMELDRQAITQPVFSVAQSWELPSESLFGKSQLSLASR